MEQVVEQVAFTELKRASTVNWLTLVGLVVKNWFASWMFFLPTVLLHLVSVFGSAAVFYLMGQFVSRGVAGHVEQYGLEYGSYIITGVMFSMLMQTTLRGYHEASLDGYWKMEFDIYLQYPGGVSAYLFGSVLAKYILAVATTIIYFAVGVWIFGIPLVVKNLPALVLLIGLAIVSLTGLGLVGGSTFSLLNFKAPGSNPVELILTFLVTILAGIYFPPTILPAWLQRVAEWLPQTHALRSLRLVLSGRAGLLDTAVVNDMTYLLCFAAVTLPIGIVLFALGMRKALRDGNLTRWS
jgi:ABC-2 type transport system permease protein